MIASLFLLWGNEICSMPLILSGSIEIPFFETIWPSNLPSVTVNTHFLGLSEMPYFRQCSKVFLRWNACSSLLFENIVISSRYITTLRPIKPQKAISMALWKVVPTLISPKGISPIRKSSPLGSKCGFKSVFFSYYYLIITIESI